MTVEGVSDVAKEVVGALGGAPALLVLILLNVTGISAAAWYLAKQEDNRHANQLVLLERCLIGREKM